MAIIDEINTFSVISYGFLIEEDVVYESFITHIDDYLLNFVKPGICLYLHSIFSCLDIVGCNGCSTTSTDINVYSVRLYELGSR
jgi:hypothetical protein